jgi:hypothetical protein
MLASVCRRVSGCRVTRNHVARSSTFAGLTLFALAALGGQAFASNTAVGLCAAPGNHYLTIQAAVTAAESLTTPRTVRVCPGIYPEQVSITSALTLEGVVNATSDAAIIVPPAGGIAMNGNDIFGNPVAAQIFVASASGLVTVSHLTVDGAGNNLPGCVATTLEGIYFQNTSGTISANVVRNQYQTDYADFGGCQNGLAINVESLGSNSVTVANNSVHAYQKNGITATGAATGPGSPGPAVIISGNYIVGLGATAMNWQGVYLGQTNAAENGVQIGFGASGSVMGNTVNDNIWGQDTSGDTGDAASGILIYASTNIAVTGNEVGSSQFGIVAVTDPTYGPADSSLITGNKVAGTQLFDAIDLCSNSNNVHTNTVYGSTESGIHIDDTCGSGNDNVVSGNTINEACAGVLLGTGSGNTSAPNTFANVTNTTLAGDVCPAGPDANSTTGGSRKVQRLRPAPYKAIKK